ncbi:MAG: glycosyltransferase [Bacillota bacterium]|nr:glycosyltransferase [Bacillota bacterium]
MEQPNVSVIIPTYNRGPILLNTLLSLKYQDYPQSRYEIILVNDASTDNTMDVVQNLNIENLKVFHKPKNQGAGAARNTGIENSEGKLVIFCDSDFVVPSSYISSHVETHKEDSSLAVSGMGHWYYLFSYDFRDQWYPFQDIDFVEVYNKDFIQERSSASKYLLTEQDIREGNFEPFLFNPNYIKDWISMYEQLIQLFGERLENFQYPWLSFCTGNLSLLRDNLTSLRGFDETFVRLEDWELGYRFFQEGGKFCFSIKAEAYQQHHPINPERNNVDVEMFKHLCCKHPSIDIYLMALRLREGLSYTNISKVLEQHKQLKAGTPEILPLLDRFEENMRDYAFLGKRNAHLNQRGLTDGKYLNAIQKTSLYKEWMEAYHVTTQ